MKSLVLVLSYLFSGLQALTSIVVFPLTVLCVVGLIGFTLKIARDIKRQKAAWQTATPMNAERLGA